jgi:radical SAM protein with 4Fe4S-binding SPASM domain
LSEPRYFRLDARCFLTPGARRGVVHNLETGEAMWLDEANTDALLRSETNEPVADPPELFGRLEERGWGFFSAHPVFVDKLRTYNVFREKRIWKETPFVATAVLQLTNDCVRRCATCAGAFCPICRVFADGGAPLTTEEWLAVVDEVALFGGQQVILTGGEALLHADVARIAAAALARGLRVQVHTSGLLAPPDDLPEVAFSILVKEKGEIAGIVERFGGKHAVTLLLEEIEPAAVAATLPGHWAALRVSPAPPSISKETLMVTPFERFFARKLTDNCLNGKIYVAYDGGVVPCFGHRGPRIGDVRGEDGFAAAIRVLVDDYWNVPADRVDINRPCARCEFRYCCNACRYVDPATQCGYDVDSSVWK